MKPCLTSLAASAFILIIDTVAGAQSTPSAAEALPQFQAARSITR